MFAVNYPYMEHNGNRDCLEIEAERKSSMDLVFFLGHVIGCLVKEIAAPRVVKTGYPYPPTPCETVKAMLTSSDSWT